MSECRIRYGRYPDERDYCLTHSQGEDDCLRARIAELEAENKRLRSPAGEKCWTCGGEVRIGNVWGYGHKPCPSCGGAGEVKP